LSVFIGQVYARDRNPKSKTGSLWAVEVVVYDVDDMEPIVTGVVSNGIWALISAVTRRLLRWQIKITHPRAGKMLQRAEPQGKGFTDPVRGTLGRLPKGHRIWLLTQDGRTENVWPQGAVEVQYDPVNKTWEGQIHWGDGANLRIIAVVAPPTSQDYFRYFQRLGDMRGWKYEPLRHVPTECVNFHDVQARVPKP
jgi:hypothetical protein